MNLPLQRGIHLCNDNFVKLFRQAYGEEASVLADKTEKSEKEIKKDFQVHQSGKENNPELNLIFNQRMFELLYARDLFVGIMKTEGSFSNARAMAQLRQYYMRLIDR